MDAPICDTDMTGRRVESLLLNALIDQRDHSKYRLIKADGSIIGTQGFISVIFRLHLTWNRKEDDLLPHTVVVKCPKASALQKIVEQASSVEVDCNNTVVQLHNDECASYELLKEIQSVPIARCYASKTVTASGLAEGAVVLEDLGLVAQSKKNFAEKLSLQQLQKITEVLADLHASSYAKNCESPNKKLLHVLPTVDQRMDYWRSFFTFDEARLTTLAEKYPKVLPDLNAHARTSLETLFNENAFLGIFGKDAHEGLLPVVFVHGDVQPLNFMFDKKDELVAVVDWQCAHRGYGPEDLARLMCTCASQHDRTVHGDEILHLYVKVFNSKLTNGFARITFDQVKKVYDKMFSFLALTFATSIDVAPYLLGGIKDSEEKERAHKDYEEHCTHLYQEAVRILDW